MGSGPVACCKLQRSSHPVGAWAEGGEAEGLKRGRGVGGLGFRVLSTGALSLSRLLFMGQ